MKFITLTNTSRMAIIDNEDYDRLSRVTWYLSPQGYAVSKSRSKSHLMHRIVLKAKTKDITDHVSGNKLDNRKSNLRVCNQSLNMANRAIGKTYKGVSYYRNNKTKPWTAQVTKNYKKLHLGYFYTAQEAAEAYNNKAKEIFGEFARLNNV